jgi:hypothetical protein
MPKRRNKKMRNKGRGKNRQKGGNLLGGGNGHFNAAPATGAARILRMPYGSMECPDAVVVSLRTAFTGLSSDSAFVELVVAGNSPFDPFQSFSAAQPVAFDDWAALYRYYVCDKSSIEITSMLHGVNTTTSACPQSAVYIYPSNVTTATASFATGESQGYARVHKAMVVSDATFNSNTSPVSVAQVKHAMSHAKMMGLTPSQYFAQQSINETSSDPNNMVFWKVGLSSLGPDAASDYNTNIVLVQQVRFWGRKNTGLDDRIRERAIVRECREKRRQLMRALYERENKAPWKPKLVEPKAIEKKVVIQHDPVPMDISDSNLDDPWNYVDSDALIPALLRRMKSRKPDPGDSKG